MRIVKIPEETSKREIEGRQLETGAVRPRKFKTKIKLSWEDLIIAFGLFVLIRGLITKEFTSAEVLSYLGFATGGGAWGYLSGSKST